MRYYAAGQGAEGVDFLCEADGGEDAAVVFVDERFEFGVDDQEVVARCFEERTCGSCCGFGWRGFFEFAVGWLDLGSSWRDQVGISVAGFHAAIRWW